MTYRVVPIKPETRTVPLTGNISRSQGLWTDSRGRPLRDIRISVTDRCNFRCRYCMPKEKFEKNHAFLAPTELLSFEEIERLAKVFLANGVRKIRITGGEPLLRKGIETLVEKLSKLKTLEGKPVDIAMTTNGSALSKKAKALAKAGLNRITVSLDSIDPDTFMQLNDVGFPLQKVLEGIREARNAGIREVKINVVVKRGINDQGLLDIVRHFKGTGVIVRFIEYMDVGTANGWRMNDVVPSSEIVDTINSEFPIEPVEPNYKGEVAERWQFKDGTGEIGFISSVSQPFCKDCSRMRLSVDGKVYNCLFATEGFDLRQMMRGGASDMEIEEALGRIWSARSDHYSEIRTEETVSFRQAAKIEMSYIGG